MTLVDLSWPIYPGMSKIPMAPDVTMRPFMEIAKGDSSNMTVITMASHIGTHMDAPCHFIPGAKSIDQMPLETFTGPVVTVAVNRGATEEIPLEDVAGAGIQAGDIVFLHTGWAARFGTPAYDHHPYLSVDLANFLVEKRVKMLGVDCVNVDMPIADRPAGYTRPIHNTLLGNDILIVENLTNLGAIAGKRARVFAFPIKYKDGDGAQTRVVAELV
ncbi:MAG TPA: cyclase family protein [Chloroflexota bacterium]|nr:cyclase family protein [Chloroflexota bacterium]